jgi:hypothetical protein
MRNVFRRREFFRPTGSRLGVAAAQLRGTQSGPTVPTATVQKEFYDRFALAVISRLWPLEILNRWIRMLNLCGNDPETIKLHLARSSSRTTMKSRWVSELLWSITDKADIADLEIPPKDKGDLVASLQTAFEKVYHIRKPIIVLPNSISGEAGEGKPARKEISSAPFGRLANQFCEDMPDGVVVDIIEVLNMYASETLGDEEEFVKLLLKSASIHAELLHGLFNCLSITVDPKLKKKIMAYTMKKNELLKAAQEEIKAFTESALLMEDGDKKSNLFHQASTRGGVQWASRPYNTQHCLSVSLHAFPVVDYSFFLPLDEPAPQPVEAAGVEAAGPMRNTEQWFHPSGPQQFDVHAQKIFLRNLTAKITVEDIRLAFIGTDPSVKDQIMKMDDKKVKNKKLREAAEDEVNLHNLELSPVMAVHLVKDDLDDVAFKFMYDLPKEYSLASSPEYTDGTTDTDATSGSSSSSKSVSSLSNSMPASAATQIHVPYLDPDADLTSEDLTSEDLTSEGAGSEAAYAYDAPKAVKIRKDFVKSLDKNRVKTALLSEKIPESYAFIVMKNPMVHFNALATDMRVLGVLVGGEMVYPDDVDKLRRLVFEVNYDSSMNGMPVVENLDGAITALSELLAKSFAFEEPLWEEKTNPGAPHGKKFTQITGPNQPAFIELSFETHADAWAAYTVLAAHPDSPGYVSWVFSKHYKWVRKQTESFQKISTPMLVDSFFRKSKNGGIKIVPDLRESDEK